MKHKYSKLQYYLWLASGSEISVLLNCPNEYNRHANIGMMICITSLFAAVTSFIAGATFANGDFGAVALFSMLWAVLIFSLDRSMVNSIKKDPDITPPIAGYLLPRLVLAVILSFFMSIPLDHIIFKERIAHQMDENNTTDWLKKRERLDSGYAIKNTAAAIHKDDQESADADNLLKSACPLSDYKNAVAEYKDSVRRQTALQTQKHRAENAKDNYYAKLKADRQDTTQPVVTDRTYDDLVKDLRSKAYALAIISRSVKSIKKTADSISADWEAGVKQNKRLADSDSKARTLKLDSDNLASRQESDRYKARLDSTRGFDTQFETLFLMPNWGVQVLKWLIFLGLTVIEILPTWLKLRTPIGQYDWEIYGRDRETAIGVKVRTDKFEKEAADIEDYRKQKETALNKKLIDRIAVIEEKLANAQLDDWENESAKNVPS